MELSAPMMRQGNIVLLTRTDGTMFSVPESEIDFAATAAAKAAPPAPPASPAITPPPSSPAEAARLSRPKARVRITDDDVAHTQESSSPDAEKKKAAAGGLTPARVEVGDYSQQKAGELLVIHGVLRNVGASVATGTRIAVAALGDKGETLASDNGTLSGGTIEPGQEIDFSAGLKVGQKTVASLRFTPMWTPAAPPAPAPAPGETAPRPPGKPATSTDSMSGEPSRPAPSAAPAPAPTPYGQGVLYAPPSAAAKTEPPADGKNGYIPGAARKEDQPKPPQ
jgi:hypothetical protein